VDLAHSGTPVRDVADDREVEHGVEGLILEGQRCGIPGMQLNPVRSSGEAIAGADDRPGPLGADVEASQRSRTWPSSWPRSTPS
jgi:hypothetical protein